MSLGALGLAGLDLGDRPGLRVTFRAGVVRGEGGGGEVAYPIPATDGATIDKANQVILVRHQGKVYAFALSCPHQNTALRWQEREGRFRCPKHKSRYTPDGVFQTGRATRNMDRLPIRRVGAQVLVDVDSVFESDEDPAGWRAAAVEV